MLHFVVVVCVRGDNRKEGEDRGKKGENILSGLGETKKHFTKLSVTIRFLFIYEWQHAFKFIM